MKKIYWRPSMVPRTVLVIIAILAIAAMMSVEVFRSKVIKPHYSEKIQAAQTMKKALEELKKYRIKNFGPIDRQADPAGSGIIGLPESPITSVTGYLASKQTSANPNWAAVMVDLYKKAGMKKGQAIAMGFSGSFPAINLAAIVAAETLNLKVIAITSLTASTWGANIPEFTWLDMERVLLKGGIISTRSAAASLGGIEDNAVRAGKGRILLENAIARNKISLISFEDAKENMDARMSLFQEAADKAPIKAYVNIGGGTISVGTRIGKERFDPGLNRKPPADALEIDSVMTRFALMGVPLIHMTHLVTLAEEFGLPKRPQRMPNVGEGDIFLRVEYNRVLASACTGALLLIVYLLLKSDIGFRIFGSSRVSNVPKHPEPMV